MAENEEIKKPFEIVESSQHRTIFVDGAMVSAAKGGKDTNFYITLTRMDFSPDTETIKDGNSTFNNPMKRVKEVSAVISPSKLFDIVSLIFKKLGELPEEDRKRYGIPDIEMITEKKGEEK